MTARSIISDAITNPCSNKVDILVTHVSPCLHFRDSSLNLPGYVCHTDKRAMLILTTTISHPSEPLQTDVPHSDRAGAKRSRKPSGRCGSHRGPGNQGGARDARDRGCCRIWNWSGSRHVCPFACIAYPRNLNVMLLVDVTVTLKVYKLCLQCYWLMRSSHEPLCVRSWRG